MAYYGIPKRSSKKKPADINVIAAEILRATTDEEAESFKKPSKKKNPHAAALGKLGGLKGGRSRAQKLSPKRRAEIARNAARARWKKSKSSEK